MQEQSFRILDKGLDAVEGFFSCGINCGIKKSRKDLAILFSRVPATAAGVFTRNSVVAAPVTVTREHLQRGGNLQAVVINSGVANACTGSRGLDDARFVAHVVAREFSIPDPALVGVASTGVIGDFLPLEKIETGVRLLRERAYEKCGDHSAALAIMTTDTFPKERSVSFSIDEKTVNLAAIAKGAGMIRPDMATMLAFLITDAAVDGEVLQEVLQESVDASFNRVTVDGDTSTNDMVLILANGSSGSSTIDRNHPDYPTFKEAMQWVCTELAKDLARDGEGATKFLNVVVEGAATPEDARKAAFTVAESMLVKTALFGEDPNWGRVMAALGRSGADFEPARVSLSVNGTPFVRDGMGTSEGGWEVLRKVMCAQEIEMIIRLGTGQGSFNVWTCDLSVDYVKINSHYS